MKTSRIASVLVVAAFMLGIFVGPASAAGVDAGGVVFSGSALVCADGVPAGKSAHGSCPAGQTGLFVPGGARVGSYSFASGNLVAGQPANCVSVSGPAPQSKNPLVDVCSIQVNGYLSPVVGVGAACGVSNGYGGGGVLNVMGSGNVYNLSEVGWVASAGGSLPVHGHYQLAGGSPLRSGGFVGLVQAQGGRQCVNAVSEAPKLNAGAANFQVVGAVAVL